VKVGRKPAVDPDTMYTIISQHNIFNNEGSLLNSKNVIWEKLSKELGGKIAPKSLYIHILKDRNGLQTKLKSLLFGIEISENNKHHNINVESDSSLSNSSFQLKYNEEFKITIPYDTYRKIRPETKVYKDGAKYRNYSVLKSHEWSDVINDELLKTHKLPCNFIYKRVKVHTDTNRSNHFIDFIAKCKDSCCGNDLVGWSDAKPNEGEPLHITVSTVNTKGQEHQHTTKRPLKGIKRKNVGLELENNLACNWRRDNVKDMVFGSYSPPNLYRLPTLRKLKQEMRNEKLGITKICPIQSLSEFKHSSRYAGSIHSIGFDPFFVHYWSTHQIAIYKDLTKSYCKISIDATGSLVKKLKRTSLNLLSSNIFLYEAVASSDFGHIAVTQMISENHDTLSILNWLTQWIKNGLRAPDEVVCDYSRALLSAITRAFCGISVESYVNNCFQILKNIGNTTLVTYVRLDVAHMIKIFCRIKCLTGLKNKSLKEFYVRGFRLLMYSGDLSNFETLLEALLTVMMSETDGWSGDSITPSERSREYILNLIKGYTDNYIATEEYNEYDNESDNDADINTSDENTENSISKFLNIIQIRSQNNANIQGNRISAYYLPELVTHVIRICKHFPLWTNVMCSVFNTPYNVASSAAIENDFKQLKTQILKFEVKPMKADKFVITHLQSIESNAKLFKSAELRNKTQKLQLLQIDEQLKSPTLIQTSEPEVIDAPQIALISQLNYTSDSPHTPLSFHTPDSPHTQDLACNASCTSYSSENEVDSLASTDSMNYQENWKGKNEELLIKNNKIRSTKYMSDAPDIDRILNTRQLRSNMNTWLQNGNLTTPVKIGKKR